MGLSEQVWGPEVEVRLEWLPSTEPGQAGPQVRLIWTRGLNKPPSKEDSREPPHGTSY